MHIAAFSLLREEWFCVTPHGRQNAQGSLHVDSSRLHLSVFPLRLAVYPHDMTVMNLSCEHTHMLSPASPNKSPGVRVVLGSGNRSGLLGQLHSDRDLGFHSLSFAVFNEHLVLVVQDDPSLRLHSNQQEGEKEQEKNNPPHHDLITFPNCYTNQLHPISQNLVR